MRARKQTMHDHRGVLCTHNCFFQAAVEWLDMAEHLQPGQIAILLSPSLHHQHAPMRHLKMHQHGHDTGYSTNLMHPLSGSQ